MSQNTLKEIKVVVDTKGAPELSKMAGEFSKMNKSVNKSSDVLSSFQKTFSRLSTLSFAGFGALQFIQTADALQKMNDRLKLSEGSVEGADRAFQGLVQVANNTKSSVEDIAVIYNRLNLSLGETGISTEALLGLTNVLQNSFRLSGASAAEAAAATIQLSQGLASGQLRGQELRSVLEQNALAGDILAKQFGTTRGKLLKFAEEMGGLNASGVLAAFANEADRINDSASRLQPTIGEAWTANLNSLKQRLKEVNQEMGISSKVINTMNFSFKKSRHHNFRWSSAGPIL
jgi:tape measure domain-containing protein